MLRIVYQRGFTMTTTLLSAHGVWSQHPARSSLADDDEGGDADVQTENQRLRL